MFLKPREQKQKTKESFSHIFLQKQHSYFWIHHDTKESKKEKESSKDEAKKRRDIQNEKSFFKTQTKTKHGKRTKFFEKKNNKKGNKENAFF